MHTQYNVSIGNEKMGGVIMGYSNAAKDNHGAVVTSCFSVRWRAWLVMLIMPVLLVSWRSMPRDSGMHRQLFLPWVCRRKPFDSMLNKFPGAM